MIITDIKVSPQYILRGLSAKNVRFMIAGIAASSSYRACPLDLQGRLLIPLFIFHKKYFSNPTFIHFAHIAFFI